MGCLAEIAQAARETAILYTGNVDRRKRLRPQERLELHSHLTAELKQYHDLWSTLFMFSDKPFDYQIDFLKIMHEAMVACIFRASINANWAKIKEVLKYESKVVMNKVAISTPRQFGKSTAISIFAAACLYCIPGIEIAIFSTGKRISLQNASKIKEYFFQLPGARERAKTNNTEIFEVTFGDDRISRMRSLPQNSEGCRGLRPDLIIVDECAFIQELFIYKNVLPLLQVSHRVLILISSPAEDDMNPFNTVQTARMDPRDETSDLIFASKSIRNLCDNCKNERKVDCTHNIIRPPFKNIQTDKMIRALYGTHEREYLREIVGYQAPSSFQIFDRLLVAKLFTAPRTSLTVPCEFIYMGLDPSGAGMGSHTAVAVIAEDRKNRNYVKVIAFSVLYCVLPKLFCFYFSNVCTFLHSFSVSCHHPYGLNLVTYFASTVNS